jgi:ABC-2 type transport system permease protein
MTSTMRILGAVCCRTWLKTARRPVVLTFSFVQPVMWILFFGFLFHRFDLGQALRGVRYLDFLVPGVCVMTVLFGASQSGIGLIRDMQTGFLQRLFASPVNPGIVLTGKLVGDVLRLLAQAVVLALLGLAVGAKLQITLAGLASTLLALGLFAIAFCSLSCLVAMRTGAQESMATFVHLVNMPLLFTSSALVPAKQMPDWLAAISRVNPLTLAVDASRDALLFGEFGSLGRALIWLAVVAAVLLGLAWTAAQEGWGEGSSSGLH